MPKERPRILRREKVLFRKRLLQAVLKRFLSIG
jgi:hypothetical protein